MDAATATDDEPVRIPVVPLVAASATVLAAIIVATGMQRLGEVIGVFAAAAALALLTLPLRRILQRVIGGAATAVSALASLIGAIIVGWLALRDLDTQMNRFADGLREQIAEVDRTSTTGRVLSSLRVDVAIDRWLDRVPELVVVGGDSGTEIGRRVFILITVVVLAAFLQASGDSIVDWVASRWPRDAPDTERAVSGGHDADDASVSPRQILRGLLAEIERRGIGAVRRSLVLATGAAVVAGTAGELIGIEGAVVLGVWAGLWMVAPTIGWLPAIAPSVGLAVVRGGGSAWAFVAITAALAVLVTVVRRRYVDAGTMPLGAAPYIGGVALGVSVGGLPGSLITLTLVAATAALLASDARPGRPTPWLVRSDKTGRFVGMTVPTGWRGAVLVLIATAGMVVVWNILAGLATAMIWIVIGAFVAIAINRPVAFVASKTGWTHRTAVAVVVGVIGAVLIVVSASGASGGLSATTSITNDLPEIVAELETSPVIGGWLADRDAAVWVEDQMADLPQKISRVRPASLLPSVGARVLDLFWTVLIGLAFLFDGGRLVRSATRHTPARYRRQMARLIGVTASALGGYAAGAALLAAVNASVVFTLALVLGIGLAPALAVWAFVWNFVPQIGGFMGGLPLIVFALVAGPVQALIAGVVFVGYQLIENHLLQPTIISAAIDVPPWGTLVAALAGGAAAGVVGAVVVTPLVGVVRVVRAELARDDFPTVQHPPTETSAGQV